MIVKLELITRLPGEYIRTGKIITLDFAAWRIVRETRNRANVEGQCVDVFSTRGGWYTEAQK